MRDLTRTVQRDRYARMRQNIPKLQAIVALGQNILRYYCRREEKREKRYMHRAIESASDVILYNTRVALKETRLLSYNKTTNYF